MTEETYSLELIFASASIRIESEVYICSPRTIIETLKSNISPRVNKVVIALSSPNSIDSSGTGIDWDRYRNQLIHDIRILYFTLTKMVTLDTDVSIIFKNDDNFYEDHVISCTERLRCAAYDDICSSTSHTSRPVVTNMLSATMHNITPGNQRESSPYDHIWYAGTFDHLHMGHKFAMTEALILARKSLSIFVTSDSYLRKSLRGNSRKSAHYLLQPLNVRISMIRNFFESFLYGIHFEGYIFEECTDESSREKILEIGNARSKVVITINVTDDGVHPADVTPIRSFTSLIVADDSMDGGISLNRLRSRNGEDEILIHRVASISRLCTEKPPLSSEEKLSSSHIRLLLRDRISSQFVHILEKPVLEYVSTSQVLWELNQKTSVNMINISPEDIDDAPQVDVAQAVVLWGKQTWCDLVSRTFCKCQPLDVNYSLMIDRWFEILLSRYTERQRFYHSMSHIYSLYTSLNEIRGRNKNVPIDGDELASLEYMIWFHDVIYTVGSQTNEMDSSGLWKKFAAEMSMSPTMTEMVGIGIVSTTHDKSDIGEDYETVKLFLDMDIGILATNPNTYDIYSNQIRLEYSLIYNIEDYSRGRIIFLEELFQKKKIFFTRIFSDEVAKRNIEREIEKLKYALVRDSDTN